MQSEIRRMARSSLSMAGGILKLRSAWKIFPPQTGPLHNRFFHKGGIWVSSSREMAAYIADQLREAGCITYRKMFGEYGIYCDGKLVALVCDNQLFIKITEEGRRLCPELPEAPPYAGAKPYFLIADIDNQDFLAKLVKVTCAVLPLPKPKKRRE